MGTGGWSYFHVPWRDRLKAYSTVFDFVEVNSTFYRVPSKALASSWRRRVPQTFEFSLRIPRSITHTYKLEPRDQAIALMETILDISDILGAQILHLLTPPSLELTRERLKGFKDLLSSLNLGIKRLPGR